MLEMYGLLIVLQKRIDHPLHDSDLHSKGPQNVFWYSFDFPLDMSSTLSIAVRWEMGRSTKLPILAVRQERTCHSPRSSLGVARAGGAAEREPNHLFSGNSGA